MKTHNATFYVQVEPVWGWGSDPPVVGAKAARLTQAKPNRPMPGTVLVKLTIQVPDASFKPLSPEAVVVIPEDMAVANLPIHAEAEDPE